MDRETRSGVLCLYALCGAPADVQLTHLISARDRVAFEDSVLDFSLGIYYYSLNVDEVDDGEQTISVLHYINDVQAQLFEELNRTGIPVSRPALTGALPEDIVAMHKELRKFELLRPRVKDKIDVWERKYLSFPHTFPSNFEIPDSLMRFASTTLEQLQESYSYFCYFKDICNTILFPPNVERNVILSELMAYFAHLSRAYIFALENDEKSFREDFNAGFLHMKRSILDIGKGIISTVYGYGVHNDEHFIDVSLTKTLLGLRHEETVLSPCDPDKSTLYRDNMKEVLMMWVNFLKDRGFSLPEYTVT